MLYSLLLWKAVDTRYQATVIVCTYYNGLYLTAYDYENIKVDEKIIILTHLPASSALAATVF